MSKTTNRMSCVLASDFYKVKKLKSVWIALALIFALSLLLFAVYMICMATFDSWTPSDPEESQMKLVLTDTMLQLGKSYIFGSVSVCGVELFVAIICCIFIGKDFSNGAISLNIARGASRTHVYFSKFIVICTLVVAYSAFSLVICGILAAIGGYAGNFTGAEFGMLMRNFFLQILAGISSASIFVMIAFLCRSSGASIACSIGAIIVLNIIVSIILNFTVATESSTAWTYFIPFGQMDAASVYGKWSTEQIVSTTVMPIVYTAVSTAIGYLTFEKRDMK